VKEPPPKIAHGLIALSVESVRHARGKSLTALHRQWAQWGNRNCLAKRDSSRRWKPASPNCPRTGRITMQTGVYVLALNLNYNEGAAAGEGALNLRGRAA